MGDLSTPSVGSIKDWNGIFSQSECLSVGLGVPSVRLNGSSAHVFHSHSAGDIKSCI